MKLSQRIYTLFAVCMMLTIACLDAQAQKKPKQPKLKGLAKELVGVWKFEDVKIVLLVPEDKLTEEQKQNYQMAQAMIPMLAETLKGKMTYYIQADGTFKRVEAGEDANTKETTGKWKLDKNLLTLTPDEPTDANPVQTSEINTLNKALELKLVQKVGEAMTPILKFVR
jgi:hypothetical protein